MRAGLRGQEACFLIESRLWVGHVPRPIWMNPGHAMFEIPRRMAHSVAPVIAIPIFRAAFTISVSKLAIELVVNMAKAR